MNAATALLHHEGEREAARIRAERAHDVNRRLVDQAVAAFKAGERVRGNRLARAAVRCRAIARFWDACAYASQRRLDHITDVLLSAPPRGVA